MYSRREGSPRSYLLNTLSSLISTHEEGGRERDSEKVIHWQHNESPCFHGDGEREGEEEGSRKVNVTATHVIWTHDELEAPPAI